MDDVKFYRLMLQFMLNDKTEYSIYFTNQKNDDGTTVTGRDLIVELIRRQAIAEAIAE